MDRDRHLALHRAAQARYYRNNRERVLNLGKVKRKERHTNYWEKNGYEIKLCRMLGIKMAEARELVKGEANGTRRIGVSELRLLEQNKPISGGVSEVSTNPNSTTGTVPSDRRSTWGATSDDVPNNQ